MRRTTVVPLLHRALPALLAAAVLWPGGPISSCRYLAPRGDHVAVGRALGEEPWVRVLLSAHARQAELTVLCPQGATVLPLYGGETLGMVAAGEPLRAQVRHQRLVLGPLDTFCTAVRLEPPAGASITLGDRRYPGVLELHKDHGAATLTAVARVPLEGYVAGVVAREVSLSWPPAALAAQAVAARSYAFYQMARASAADAPAAGAGGPAGRPAIFDLRDDTGDQVYGGLVPNDDPRGDQAARATRGLVLGSLRADHTVPTLFKPFYHSTCGGRTESAALVFGADFAGIPALAGGVVCEDCRASPLFSWRRQFTRAEFAALAAKAGGGTAGTLRALAAEGAAGPRRDGALRVTFEGEAAPRRVTHLALRAAAGGGRGEQALPSARFEAFLDDGVVIHGAGWGHGVGMCQTGAKGKAERGLDWQAILQSYYPDARLLRLY